MALSTQQRDINLKDRIEYAASMMVLMPMLWLPHRWRVPFAGAFVSRVAAPILGWHRRIGTQLDLAMPELAPPEKKRLTKAVSNHMGRLFIELFCPDDMAKITRAAEITGPGVADLQAALDAGRPVVCVSGHFGNYDVYRAALVQMGFDVGSLYRPLNSKLLNDYYVSIISKVGGPMFPRGRRGFGEMVRHLRDGGLLALLVDQHMNHGAPLTFMGLRAYTPVSAAQLALKYNAALVPGYAIRLPDGIGFRVEIDAEVPHTDEETMTQVLNDSIEVQVRAHPAQWMWTHRRWKNKAGTKPQDEDNA